MSRNIDILGEKYTIYEQDMVENPALVERSGYTDPSTKEIYIDSQILNDSCVDAQKNLEEVKKSVIRHEIIHCVAYESGLNINSWASDEEIIDWFALQAPKLFRIFKDAGAL